MTLQIKYDADPGCCYVKNLKFIGCVELHVHEGFEVDDFVDLLVTGCSRYNREVATYEDVLSRD